LGSLIGVMAPLLRPVAKQPMLLQKPIIGLK
jgi:hypothetical protein